MLFGFRSRFSANFVSGSVFLWCETVSGTGILVVNSTHPLQLMLFRISFSAINYIYIFIVSRDRQALNRPSLFMNFTLAVFNFKTPASKGRLWFIFIKKIAIYLSLGLHKGRPSYKRSLRPSKENTQHFKTWNLIFSIFVGFFCPPRSESGCGSTDLIESGSDPDAKHWFPICINLICISF